MQGVASVTLDSVTVEKALSCFWPAPSTGARRIPDYYLVYNARNVKMSSRTSPRPASRFSNVARDRPQPAAAAAAALCPRERIRCAGHHRARHAALDVISRPRQDRPAERENRVLSARPCEGADRPSLLPRTAALRARRRRRNTLAITAPRGTLEQIVSQINRLDVPLAAGSFDLPPYTRPRIVKLNHAKALSDTEPPAAGASRLCAGRRGSNTLAISAPDMLVAGSSRHRGHRRAAQAHHAGCTRCRSGAERSSRFRRRLEVADDHRGHRGRQRRQLALGTPHRLHAEPRVHRTRFR